MANINKKIASLLGPYFYQFADKSEDVFWVRSADFHKQVYINPAYETRWGYSCEQLYSNPTTWMQAILAEDRDRVRQSLMELQAHPSNASLFQSEFRIRTVKGQVRTIRETVMAIYEGNACLGYMGIARDITKQLDSSPDLHDVSYFFRFFAERTNSVFWVHDVTSKKQLYVSPAFERVWGIKIESLYANPQVWSDTLLPEDLPSNEMRQRIAETDEGKLHKQFENRYRIRRPDGEIRWIKDTNFPILDEQGEPIGFAGIAEDITQDALREQQLREAKEIAEIANHAKADFLAMMSHELRTPLNAILGMAQILNTSKLSGEQRDHVEVIIKSGHNLLALLNDILDFAKLEVGKLTFSNDAVSLSALCDQVISDLLPSAREKKIKLLLDFSPNSDFVVQGDAKRLRQILSNLIVNAIKFTNQGHVKLKVFCLQQNNLEATLCFTIEDTGIGIEQVKINTIFNRFQQIDSVYQRKHDGVGLGLAIVKELVQQMGGSIAVTSEVGRGSQFTCIISFRLYTAEMAQFRAEQDAQLAEGPLSSDQFNLKILVVEDNLINQKISRTLLEQIGCRVDIVDDGFTAIKKAKNNYDLIFMDIGLPDMDGFEAAKRIRHAESNGKRVPIVAMTAHVFAHDRQRCFEVGMDEVIAKPIMRDDLLTLLKRWKAD